MTDTQEATPLLSRTPAATPPPPPLSSQRTTLAPALPSQHSVQPPSSLRSLLSLRERKLKNLHKRVKLRSKRLRTLWPAITAFLDVQSTAALASTCRRMQQMMQDDRVWQAKLAAVRSEKLSQLVVDRQQRDRLPASAKQQLQRLVHARRVLDPTNSLQQRLREAERDVFRAATRQRKMRELSRIVAAFALVLLCISVWGFRNDARRRSAPQATSLRPRKHEGSPAKTFAVALDALSLVMALLLSCGATEFSESALASATLLALLECATMAFACLAAVPSLDELLRAGVVLLAAVTTAVTATCKQQELEREVAAFVGIY